MSLNFERLSINAAAFRREGMEQVSVNVDASEDPRAMLAAIYNLIAAYQVDPPKMSEAKNAGERLRQFPLFMAVLDGDMKAMHMAMQDPPQQVMVQIAFYIACYVGNCDMISFFLHNKHVDPRQNDSLSLRFAVRMRRGNAVKLLLADERADPTARGNEAWKVAKKYKMLGIKFTLKLSGRIPDAVLLS
jgi:hypothetical protein